MTYSFTNCCNLKNISIFLNIKMFMIFTKAILNLFSKKKKKTIYKVPN